MLHRQFGELPNYVRADYYYRVSPPRIVNNQNSIDVGVDKLPYGAGRMLRTFFHQVDDFIDAHSDHNQFGDMIRGFAKAFDAEVTAFSTSKDKEAEAKSLGAHHFVSTRLTQLRLGRNPDLWAMIVAVATNATVTTAPSAAIVSEFVTERCRIGS